MLRRRLPLLALAAVLSLLAILYFTNVSTTEMAAEASRRLTGYIVPAGENPAQAAQAAELAQTGERLVEAQRAGAGANAGVPAGVLAGKPIMKKMANETKRAELGRAAWKVFHTILAQYPDEPDTDARETLATYISLFSRVYPCAECAEHFQELLKQYPPQLSTRKAAVMWGCDAHNKVNKRLGKELFDCAYIDDKYDCGCGSPEEDAAAADAAAAAAAAAAKGAGKAGKAAAKDTKPGKAAQKGTIEPAVPAVPGG